MYDNDGTLFNLKNTIPQWAIYLTIISATIFFFWWIVFRPSNKNSWIVRPDYFIKRVDAVGKSG